MPVKEGGMTIATTGQLKLIRLARPEACIVCSHCKQGKIVKDGHETSVLYCEQPSCSNWEYETGHTIPANRFQENPLPVPARPD